MYDPTRWCTPVHRTLLCLLACGTVLPAVAHAQTAYAPGVLAGQVVDANGRAVPNAGVTLINESTQTQQRVTSNASGAFVFNALPAAAYHLTIAAGSYGALSQRFTFDRSAVAGETAVAHLSDVAADAVTGDGNGTLDLHATQAALAGSIVPASVPSKTARSKTSAMAVQTAGTNSAADFTIYSTVINSAPYRFGFNIDQPDGSGPADNHFIQYGGFSPYDYRFALRASQDGTDTTFISVQGGNAGTDNYKSIATGYFNGANARVYRLVSNVWTLVRTGVVQNYTADGSSTAASAHTITFTTSGAATKSGDVIWLNRDGDTALPDPALLDPRFTYLTQQWNHESAQTAAAYALDTTAPAEENYNGPANRPGLSMKVTDTATEHPGIWQYLQPLFKGSADGFETSHTYRFSIWLKQSGVSDGSVKVNFKNLGLTHTFTGVTGTWQKFTWDFAGVANAASIPEMHITYNSPGTMWIDNVRVYDTAFAADTWDPRLQAALTNFKPSVMRIWSNFSSTAGEYYLWSLDSWLADEGDSRSGAAASKLKGAKNSTSSAPLEHLPTSLARAKLIGADPWIIASMSFSEQEWSDLIDYLCAPAGQGYAQYRPANHPGPYTVDFNRIYVEFGNEEWGTQTTPVNGSYGQWMHHMLSQAIAGKSYFDANKIKFVGNGQTGNVGFASSAASQAPEVSIFDFQNYTYAEGTEGTDAFYQNDLLSLMVTHTGDSISLQQKLDNTVSQQQADLSHNHPYDVAIYEGGPGNDSSTNGGDGSLAAAVGALDADLYATQRGFGPTSFFRFQTDLGTNGYTSHTSFAKGLIPHPAWLALQMRNNYVTGAMVQVKTNTNASVSGLPAIGTYAFHDASAGNVAQVFVVSRDLNNTTPVTLHFPGTPSGAATLYTLTGDPRANNDSSLTIPINSSSVTLTKDYTFNMPPGSIYLFVVPTGTWSTNVPVPDAPTNLHGTPGAGQVRLSWTSVEGASSYSIKRSTVAGGPYTQVGTSTLIAYTDTTVTNGTTYYYVVSAVNPGGASGNSNEFAAKPDVAVATYVSAAPPLDGSATGAWASATAYPYQHKNSGNTPDTGTFRLLWDNNNLYALVTVQDSTPSQSTSVWNGDSVELYIDGSNSKPSTYSYDDFQYAFPWNGTTVYEASKNATSGVLFGQQTISGGYQMAMKLPWSTLQVSSPAAGNFIGFDTMVNDASPANTKLGKIAWWATADTSWQDPSQFGNVLLSGAPATPPMAYEPFNASAGALLGLNDGSGWSAAWEVQSNNATVPGYNTATAAPLSYSGVSQTGNYAVGGNSYYSSGRHLNTAAGGPFNSLLTGNMIGATGKTVYLSFLMRKDASNSNPVYVALHGTNTAWYANVTPVEAGTFGATGTQYWGIKVNGTVYNSAVPVTTGQTVFLVMAVTFGSTNTVKLYVNPAGGGAEPATPSVSTTYTGTLTFGSVAYYAGNTTGVSSVDEIRVGDTYSSVNQ